ncbi:class I SAM-dependent methyltransferase [Rhodopirellula sp. SWK7]|uniref:class I SAM-dependent methyltransferase n=1 Tax=Rhodopirellula sp. SWK7 TaxID=595460 RepID=UPI0002BF5A2F|nr:class I SAM-dependent methyltransferase [Rhodopirellula sp. SWK7]EMI44579.1 Methyltransferase type 11 domain protein [Rhodopirellula sp. SWK7]
MLNPLQVLPIVFGQAFVPQTLERTPEQHNESAVMDEEQSVRQYDEAMKSKLAIVYAGALERIHRIRRRTEGGKALDLCCGPGHFTLLLAKYFDYDEVVGVDLSPKMIEAANRNAEAWGLADRVRFEVADATAVPADNGAYDLVTCNDAAHHMPDLTVVSDLIVEMDRLAADDGMVQVTDLVRLKSDSLTKRYTKLIGQDYLDRGLDQFQLDFCNSMQAAWTDHELRQCLPRESAKVWQHTVQKCLPTVQFLTGYADDGQPMVTRKGTPWSASDHPVPAEFRQDWKLFRLLF